MAKVGSGRNYGIIIGAELDTKQIDEQLKKKNQELKGKSLDVDVSDAQQGLQDLTISFQAANAMIRATADTINSMVEQVYAFDDALVEFQKVSDLSGESLSAYVDTLNTMGDSVARTGRLTDWAGVYR